jgi:hypothetical protein
MDSDTRFALIVLGLPIAGLVYCGLGIAALASFSVLREHALVAGGAFILVPFVTAASIWLRASAKAYRN